jgi:hypothetical protein
LEAVVAGYLFDDSSPRECREQSVECRPNRIQGGGVKLVR